MQTSLSLPTPPANGQWAKKIKGRTYYFGVWADPQAALETYLSQRDYLDAGQQPPSPTTALADLLNAFHHSKKLAAEEGNLPPR